MDSSLGIEYNLMFLALGWGFAMVAMVLSWASADHGLHNVRLASRSRDEKRCQVLELTQREPELRAEYRRVYYDTRKRALIVIEQGKALSALYKHQVQKNSRYSDIDMVFPEIQLPPELESPEPPPLIVAYGDGSALTKEA
jgi:hypothetical protein